MCDCVSKNPPSLHLPVCIWVSNERKEKMTACNFQTKCVLAAGQHMPDFLKLILCGLLSVCLFVYVSASKAINN